MTPSTYFGLLAEFGTAHVSVIEIGAKYFGLSEKESKRKASGNEFPFPVFRAGGNKTTWLADIVIFADYLDKVKDKAKAEFKSAN